MEAKPQAMLLLANLLYALAAVLLLYGLLFLAVHLPLFPLREVQVVGALNHVTREQVEAIVKRELKGGFFTVRLDGARRAFEKLPWVRGVDLRRKWPDRLVVGLEEHTALARWGDSGLVNYFGEVFEAASDPALPLFSGPAGSAQEVMHRYRTFAAALAAIRRQPAEVRLSSRRAWQLRLDDGAVLELGRDQVDARLERFVAAYPRTVGRLARGAGYVDLRYPNGFSVRVAGMKWPEGKGSGGAAKR